jgi:DNA-binding CsgD family transcriptional regulator/PAS domain-containing protein
MLEHRSVGGVPAYEVIGRHTQRGRQGGQGVWARMPTTTGFDLCDRRPAEAGVKRKRFAIPAKPPAGRPDPVSDPDIDRLAHLLDPSGSTPSASCNHPVARPFYAIHMTMSIDALSRHGPVPRWVGAYAERLIAARGQARRLKRVFDRSPVPMLLVDDERRYVEANTPARLALRQSIEELRRLRVDDLTPRDFWPTMQSAWERLMDSGCTAGPYQVASPVGTRFEVVYYALANASPGLHLVAFAPASWPDCELIRDTQRTDVEDTAALTPRETEILELAAEGHSAPQIADELVVSPATVRTHFEHIYTKLGVRDRAGAVASAMRRGLIA